MGHHLGKPYCFECGEDFKEFGDQYTHKCDFKETKKAVRKFGQENGVMAGLSV